MKSMCLALIGLLLFVTPALAQEDGEGGFTGSVELLYRNVSQDGSTEKYDEDFDGLDSGTRLGSLSLNWTSSESNVLDYARLDATGLGGDPYERTSFRIDFDDALAFRIHGVTADFVREMYEAGFEDLDSEDLLRIRIHGLDDILRKRRRSRRN